MWWFIWVIPATDKADTGGSQFKACPGKVSEILSQKKARQDDTCL
jgi:hypothetical protein